MLYTIPTTANLHPLSTRQTLVFVLLTLAGAAAMTSIFQKLTRPFTSSTLRFAPEQTARMDVPEGAQKCTLAAGCFWGVEHMYRKDFGNKGLLDARVGYIGGDTNNPSYRSVCSGTTGRECFCFKHGRQPANTSLLTQMPKRSKSSTTPPKSPTAA